MRYMYVSHVCIICIICMYHMYHMYVSFVCITCISSKRAKLGKLCLYTHAFVRAPSGQNLAKLAIFSQNLRILKVSVHFNNILTLDHKQNSNEFKKLKELIVYMKWTDFGEFWRFFSEFSSDPQILAKKSIFDPERYIDTLDVP